MRFLAVIFFLTDLDLTASALSVLAFLLEDTVGRMSRGFLVFVFVDFYVPLAVGAALVAALVAACVFCTRVLPDGASLLGTNLAADRCFLR